uniref:Uncharacterized protein n=1 Tax=Daucus carota subsp. sativus TaxID=79200 RepID=A0A166D110_DAUCS
MSVLLHQILRRNNIRDDPLVCTKPYQIFRRTNIRDDPLVRTKSYQITYTAKL